MSTAEDEERQMSLISEVSATHKSNSVNAYSNFPAREHEVNEVGDINNAFASRDFHQALVKSNSVLGNGGSKLTNHNGEDGEINENDDLIKVNSSFVSAKDVNSGELDEKENNGVNFVSKPAQIILTTDLISSLSKEELVDKWNLQDKYIRSLQSTLETALQEVAELKRTRSIDERLKSQLSELQRKEQYHIMRLATKEHEIQELGAQIEELKNLTTGGNSLKNCLLDPAVNLLFERMKRDFDTTKSKMEETQNELAAWKFTPDSNTGKQLMAKCRLLIKENEELGKMISSGRLAKLEGDLALQRSFSDELKKSQSELEEFLQEMDEDTEGMQGTILYLQNQLRQAKDKINHLTNQNNALGQSTPNNNTPASGGEGAEYPEDPFTEMDTQIEDPLQKYSEEGRNLLESVDDKFLSSDIDTVTTGTKPNGDLKSNFIASGSSNTNAQFKAFASGRKRTQSALEEPGLREEGLHGEVGQMEQLSLSSSPNKRTRVDNDGVGSEAGVSEPVVENGLSIK